MSQHSISAPVARRIALGAQGFGIARPTGRVDRRHLRRVLGQIGLIQIDSVNVLVRSQELPLWSRLGAHPRSLIPDATDDAELFEYWVHEACHVPTAHHHLHRWRMQQPRTWRSRDRLERERPGYLDQIERYVADNGPVVAGDVKQRDRPTGAWWDWDDGKLALEVLFDLGRLTATRRRRDFARVYDLPSRVFPAEVLARPAPAEADARKELLVLAAQHYGVATDKDLADYHRQKVTDVRPLLGELVEDGRLLPTTVEGWDSAAYLDPDVRTPRSIDAVTVLSPFDPVVWYRDRAERLFDFHYRIEIYTPREKRVYGYYVLPFLLGDRLVGRVDLKADRQRSQLLVQAAWVEPGHDHADVAAGLTGELAALANWLELESVVNRGVGNLAL